MSSVKAYPTSGSGVTGLYHDTAFEVCVMSSTYYTSMCEGQLLITLVNLLHCYVYLLHCLHMDSEQ